MPPASPSDTRQRILDLVRAEPGIPLSSLRAAAGVGWGALYHHLGRLEADGALRRVAIGGRRLVVPADSAEGLDVSHARAIVSGRTTREIARAIAAGEADDVAGIAARQGLRPRSVSYHVQRLARAGLVDSASRHRYVRLRPTPLLRKLLGERDA